MNSAVHAQGVVHRDIKPDNLLLTEDDVLKVVDFGVSEMFEKQSEMMTAKSAGSPAFLPPELCVAKHGDISGKAADIWSMGVSLYCLRFGRIPFERPGVLELYEAIKHDKIDYKPDDEPLFVDLMEKILEKDPKKRIQMRELRVSIYTILKEIHVLIIRQEHPWVTRSGADPLLSEEENTAELVDPPTEIEVNHAITSNLKNLMTVVSFCGLDFPSTKLTPTVDESSGKIQIPAMETTSRIDVWDSGSRRSDCAATTPIRRPGW
jgi:[calcium/calmodulin-dependent protein kinase] kinase